MADEDNTTAQTTLAAPSTDSPAASSPQEPPPVQSDPPPPTDRTELIQRARAFLTSPQVRHEDASAKRRFLAEKGLTDTEIEGLLYEVVRRVLRPTLPMSQRSSRPAATACSPTSSSDSRVHLGVGGFGSSCLLWSCTSLGLPTLALVYLLYLFLASKIQAKDLFLADFLPSSSFRSLLSF